MKRKRIEAARVELLPPTALAPRPDARAMLKQLVRDQVAEVLASRDELLLRPFFDQKKVSDELRRVQTIPERRKWSLYFATWGCVRCRTRRAIHASCGMCPSCKSLVKMRLRSILKNSPELPLDHVDFDSEKIARKALKTATRALPQGKSDRRERR